MNEPPSDSAPTRPNSPREGDPTNLSTVGASPPTESIPLDDPSASHAASRPLISGYQILRELHHGGQGVVYEAIQKSTNRKVAIKMLLDEHYASEPAKKRFQREVKLVAQMRHPNIIAVHDSGLTADGRCFFVMDYVRGTPLRQYVQAHRLPLDRVLEIFTHVCAAVDHAHQRGVIHRDLKPSNILVDADGTPIVLDFGLAKSASATVETLVSHTGQLIGTWPYMSPEQTRALPEELDARSDVYALGVVLYEILTGCYPYPMVGSLEEVLKRIRDTPPALPSRLWDPLTGVTPRSEGSGAALRCPLDKDLDTILLKALAKEPERRYQTAGDLARDLERYRRGDAIAARRDSITYVLRKRGRALAQRHRVTTLGIAIVVAAGAAHFVGTPLVFRWTPAHLHFERFVTGALAPPSAGPAFGNVRVIAVTERTQAKELEDAMAQKNFKPLRPLHGRLMEALASSGCRTVVFDVVFPSETEFDDAFLKGVRALREVGIDVVVCVKSWWLDPDEMPKVSANFLRDVKWGCAVVRLSPRGAFVVQLVAKRGLADPQPSVALASFAAYRQPGHDFDIVLDRHKSSLDLRYWSREPRVPQAKQLSGSDHIDLTAAHAGSEEYGVFQRAFDTKFGLQSSDILGFQLVVMPSDDVLTPATLEYGDVLTADPSQLREWLSGTVAVVGNFLDPKDRYPLPDGRVLPGGYIQAAAIDWLIRGLYVRMPKPLDEWLILLAGALIGAVTAVVAWPHLLRRYLLLIGLAGLFLLTSLVAYRSTRYLFNPMLPILALWMSCELGAVLSRIFQGGPISSLERRPAP